MAKPELVSGTFSGPPPGAPIEIGQPLGHDAGAIVDAHGIVHTPIEKAKKHEKTLAPLTYGHAKPVAPPPPPSSKPEVISIQIPAADAAMLAATTDIGDMIKLGTDDPIPDFPSPDAPPDPEPYQPAASNTDSPSRGIPHPSHDPGKQVTGGFGAMENLYYPLNGDEIASLARRLWTTIDHQMGQDLRFMMAACYPLAKVSLTLTVDVGDGSQAAFNLQQSKVVDLLATRVDDQDTPADALRDEAGLRKPFKHAVKQGRRTSFVDVDV